MRLDLLLEFEDEILSYLIFILFIMSYRILLIYYLTRSNLQSLTFHLSLILYIITYVLCFIFNIFSCLYLILNIFSCLCLILNLIFITYYLLNHSKLVLNNVVFALKIILAFAIKNSHVWMEIVIQYWNISMKRMSLESKMW